MYITDASAEKASAMCDKVAKKPSGDYRQLCYDGVFMQMFQPLEPEDFALVKGKQPTAQNVNSYCDKYPIDQRASCYNESWPLFRDQILDPLGLPSFCAKVGSEYEDRCYNALFFVVTAQLNLDFEKVYDYCRNIDEKRRPQCFANAAGRLVEVDYKNIPTAIKLCSSAQEFDPEGKCFNEMIRYSTYNFHKGSDNFYAICNNLPEKWKKECLENPRRGS
jgi:hypothetical protein